MSVVQTSQAPRIHVSVSIIGSISVSLFLFTGGVLEVVKNSVIAYRYGSGRETDAFFAAYVIPATYAMYWVSSCLVGLVPLLAQWEKKSRERLSEIIASILLLSLATTMSLAAFGYFAAPWIMRFLAPGFSAPQKLQAIHLFRELLPLLVFVGFTGVATAILNNRRWFLLPAAQKLAVNILVIAGLLVWYGHQKIDWLAELIVGGTLLYSMILAVQLWRAGVGLKRESGLRRCEIHALGAALLFPFAALTIRQSSALVERMIASLLPAGSISELVYSYQFIFGFAAVIVAGVTTTLMPALAQQESKEEILTLIQKSMHYLLVVVLPLAFGVYLLAAPMVLILFHHGAFGPEEAARTTNVFRAYAFGIIFIALAMLFQTPFWADRRYRLVIIHNGIMALLNVLLDLPLAAFKGVSGLAFGYTLTAVASCLRMAWLLHRDYGPVLNRSILRSTAKAILATLTMAIVVAMARKPVASLAWSQRGSFSGEILSAAVLVCVGLLTYIASGVAARMEPFPTLYGSFRARFREIWDK